MNRSRPPAATRVGRRRGGIRQAAADRVRRSVEAIVQPVNRIPTYALLDSDAEEAIHQASMRVLEEIGVDFRGETAKRLRYGARPERRSRASGSAFRASSP